MKQIKSTKIISQLWIQQKKSTRINLKMILFLLTSHARE